MLGIGIAILCILACSVACARISSSILEAALKPLMQVTEYSEILAKGRMQRPIEGKEAADASSEFRVASYVERFLLEDLRQEQDVRNIKIKPTDKEGIKQFLEDYCTWANNQDWTLVHEFAVEADTDIVVVGDLHGHFASLRAVFNVWLERLKKDPRTRLVFLGDFVDRGQMDMETAIAILALQMWMNGRVFVLRGNHENDRVKKLYSHSWTFFHSIRANFAGATEAELDRIWDLFVRAFWRLPVGAVVTRGSQKYLMLHGGWNKEVLENWQLGKTPMSGFSLKYPRISGHQPLQEIGTPERFAYDLVWSDVFHSDFLYGNSNRSGRDGSIKTYGYQAILEMLDSLGIDWCISGHKHKNLLWRPESLAFTKGHAVVLSASAFDPSELGAVVVIEAPDPTEPGLTCCCGARELFASRVCKYHFSQHGCCKFKQAPDCHKHGKHAVGQAVGLVKQKYRKQSPTAHCGSIPRQYTMNDKFVSAYTFNGMLTEGHRR